MPDIDIQAVKMLMAGRAGVYGLLADAFTFPFDMENVYNLCKYLYDLNESVESIDDKEEIIQGFKGLATWYHNAEKADKSWVEKKLQTEFAEVFKNPTSSIGIIFPNTENINEAYKKNGYSPEFKEGGVNEILSFMSHMAIEMAKKDNGEDIAEKAEIQYLFLEKYVTPCISAFCEALYEASSDYGIYQYIAVILHGYIMLDIPTLNYFKNYSSNPLS